MARAASRAAPSPRLALTAPLSHDLARRLPGSDVITFDLRLLTFLLLPLKSLAMAGAANRASCVIGVDPGLNVTGYGVLRCRLGKVKLLEAGVIRSPGSQAANLPARLESLFAGLREVIQEFRPETLCLEDVYSHTEYPRTSILMGHARGVICLAARLAQVPVVSFSAKRIKQSMTGNGNASKLQVQRAVQQFFSLHRLPQPPDVADALATALCYVNSIRVGVMGFGLKRAPKRVVAL